MKPSILNSAAVLFLLGGAIPAEGAPGDEPFQFLIFDAGARSVALGGAVSALGDDAFSIFGNPAGLAAVERGEASFMHNEYLQGVRQEMFVLAFPAGFGAGLSVLDSGAIRRTTLSDPGGDGLGETRLRSGAAVAGYGRRVGGRLSLGICGKLARETIDGTSASGRAVDAGAILDAPAVKGLSLAVSVRNAGPPIRFENAEERLPLLVRAGAAYRAGAKDGRVSLAVDAVRSRSGDARAMAGVELLFDRRLAVRGGWDGRVDAGPGLTAGLGIRTGAVRIDYAFAPFGVLGQTHRLSAGFLWGPVRR